MSEEKLTRAAVVTGGSRGIGRAVCVALAKQGCNVAVSYTHLDVYKRQRQCREDSAILGGIARFHGMPVTVIGHRKGSTLEENMACNFGMPGPEGYRKALRLMKQAEKFGRPIITFIDTPGAYPGKEAEERGQGEAIARNLMEMSGLTVPVIAVVTGEGSSGGCLLYTSRPEAPWAGR